MNFFRPRPSVLFILLAAWLLNGFFLYVQSFSTGCLRLMDASGKYVGNCGFNYTIPVLLSTFLLLSVYLLVSLILYLLQKR